MPVLKHRDRMVIFRLTQEEYENLKAACVLRGARNVSDFARSQLLLAMDRERSEVLERLSEIQSGMHRLEQSLDVSLKRGGKK